MLLTQIMKGNFFSGVEKRFVSAAIYKKLLKTAPFFLSVTVFEL